jgi:hypothetical protein
MSRACAQGASRAIAFASAISWAASPRWSRGLLEPQPAKSSSAAAAAISVRTMGTS